MPLCKVSQCCFSSQLARFSSQLEAMRGRAETLAQDLTQAEKSFPTVKSERELQDLQDLLRRQQKIEVRSEFHPITSGILPDGEDGALQVGF